MRVRLIVNPTATGVTAPVRDAVVAVLERVCELEVMDTEGPGHARELAAGVAAGAVLAMGGDGTANEVMNGVGDGILAGVLPAGASSVFARHLGFPNDPVEAAIVMAEAIRSGRTRGIGLGTLDGRRFTFAAGLGLDAEATAVVDRMRHERAGQTRPGDWRVLAAALGVLREDGFALHERMTLELPGGTKERASYVAVANQHPYTYFGPVPVRAAPRAGFNHRLDVVFARELRRRDLWRLPVYALVYPRHARGGSRRIGYMHDIGAVRIRCDQPTALQVDGEYLGHVDGALVEYVPDAVRMFVPAGRRERRDPPL